MFNKKLVLNTLTNNYDIAKLHIAKQQDGSFDRILDIPIYKDSIGNYLYDFSSVELSKFQYEEPVYLWDKYLSRYVNANLQDICTLDLQNHLKYNHPFISWNSPYTAYTSENYYEIIKNNGLYCTWRQYAPYKYIDGDEYLDVITPIKFDIIFDPVIKYNDLLNGVTIYDVGLQQYNVQIYNTRGFGCLYEDYDTGYDIEYDAFIGVDTLTPLSYCAGDEHTIMIEYSDYSDPPHTYYIANAIKHNIKGITQTLEEYSSRASLSFVQATNSFKYRYCNSIQFLYWGLNGASVSTHTYNQAELSQKADTLGEAIKYMYIDKNFASKLSLSYNNELRLLITEQSTVRDPVTICIAYLGIIPENQDIECISIIPNIEANAIFSDIMQTSDNIAYNAGYWKGKI